MHNYYKFVNNFKNYRYLMELNRQTIDVNLLSKTPVLERPTLKFGDSGQYVNLLQEQLKQLMFYDGLIDGNFDNDTLISVKAFQTNNKLTVDGIVGNDTWSALIYLYSPLDICTTSYYIIEKGDTLWSLAKRYNTSVESLKNLNNLSSDFLSIGQIIKIPERASSNEIIYTVIKGDTLWRIAEIYNTSVDKIKSYNNLSSTLLSIGQKLKIPSDNDIINYTVVKGDTLWSIAKKYNTTVEEIKILNNLSNNLISINQVLKIRNL